MTSDHTKMEKNWVLLRMNQTHVDMIRAFFPLRVLSCDLLSGVCVAPSQQSRTLTVGPMRGGTPMIELHPNFFIGWARTHLVHCSCSVHFYRAHLVIVRKVQDNYVLASISSPFDFGLSGVEQAGSNKCERRDHYINAVIPVTISVADANRMTVLLYRQDRERIIVKICGIVNWVLKLAEKPFEIRGEENVGRCAVQAAYKQCRTYPQR
jgi:hypothetical protein